MLLFEHNGSKNNCSETHFPFLAQLELLIGWAGYKIKHGNLGCKFHTLFRHFSPIFSGLHKKSKLIFNSSYDSPKLTNQSAPFQKGKMRVKVEEKNRISKRRKSDEKIEKISEKPAQELSLDLPFHDFMSCKFFFRFHFGPRLEVWLFWYFFYC